MAFLSRPNEFTEIIGHNLRIHEELQGMGVKVGYSTINVDHHPKLTRLHH